MAPVLGLGVCGARAYTDRVRILGLALLFAALGAAAPRIDDAEGWTLWSPREEIQPRGWSDPLVGREAPGSLALSGASKPGVFGEWRRAASAVEPGRWYRLTAYYRTKDMPRPSERQHVAARIAWLQANGKGAGRQEYAWKTEREGEWTKLSVEAPAPPDAAAARLELRLAYAPTATLWWDDVSFEPVETPAARPVKVATVNLRPLNTGGREGSIERFAELVEKDVPADTDLILLPEGATIVGTGLKYPDIAETVPGPTTERLGQVAKAKNAWLAVGLYEREGTVIYNTAVLLDREGRVAGKYRKVYLPREEMDGGLTPGDSYPTFQTDFGRVGMMICWDVQYADPARALALDGAEVVLLPIWGGSETLAAARAIENHVFLVTSGYDHPTYVMDPMGERMAQAPEGKVAVATIDLAKRYEWPWLGSMRGRFYHEIRRDVPVE
ncbi:MAG: hypothetical protein GC160_02430 [Acidobacteria bacterium]|nr:hypothetical protein [Acidobacteriota bacterium]